MPPMWPWLPMLYPDGDGAGGSDGSGTDGNGDDGDAGAGGDGAGDDSGLKSALQKERDARKQAEKDLKSAQKRLTDLENAGKSDAEKLTGELSSLQSKVGELTGRVRTANGQEAVRKAAKAAGAADVDLVWRSVRADLDYSDEDEPENVATIMQELKAEHPDLFKVRPPKGDTGGEGTRGKATALSGDWLRAALAED